MHKGPSMTSSCSHLSWDTARVRPLAWMCGHGASRGSSFSGTRPVLCCLELCSEPPRLVASANTHCDHGLSQSCGCRGSAEPFSPGSLRGSDGGWTGVIDGSLEHVPGGCCQLASRKGPVAETFLMASPGTLGSLPAWWLGSRSECPVIRRELLCRL